MASDGDVSGFADGMHVTVRLSSTKITVSKVNNAGNQILKRWFGEGRIRIKINKH